MDYKTYFFEAFALCPKPLSTQVFRSTINYEENNLHKLLVNVTSRELATSDIRTEIGGHLSMLAPETFRYFLPSFMYASLEEYQKVSVFASEFIEALTKPSRDDIAQSFERMAQIPNNLSFSNETTELIQQQQTEWFDSGIPGTIFHERVNALIDSESLAVLTFLNAFKEAYGEDFPFGELETAIERYWVKYR